MQRMEARPWVEYTQFTLYSGNSELTGNDKEKRVRKGLAALDVLPGL